jgi:hypothetical protein
MARFDIHNDAVWQMATRHDSLAVGTVRIHGVNAARIQLKDKQAGDNSTNARASIALGDGFRHVAPVL